jgi:ribosomal-protein-alanine N-acetyltransferase
MPETFPLLTSQRLRLRRLESLDEQEIFALRSDERVNLHLDRAPAQSLDDAKNFIRKIDTLIKNNEGFYWAICLKENPRLIGTICYFNFSQHESSAEIGYELSPFYQGKGIMQEAISIVIQFGFNVLGLKTITAFPSKENLNSIKLLKRNGFEDAEWNDEDGKLVKYILMR